MKLNKRDIVRLKHIQGAIVAIQSFTEGVDESSFNKNELIQSAVIRQFEIIGEASSRVTEETQQVFPEVEWRTIKNFRNLLIHEYFRVDAAEVWYSVLNDLPVLKSQIEEILARVQ
ncbi:HepT-like ribonuclease domain-containing protein [Gracilimonas mengyeensis]|uniref:Uncharacterized conserved protein, contains HEPN domain n=1 Tax=Gracilimonas mengyeensis TaxID=1302730 RepID=A0A521BFT7_9BACT|nr:DUF86 domain-containing protein [Gracilimonas mengyeensis]SMO45958.1 Uncharacterized conserved protein, contains HEPN domain [Gracilimonas mengyeensis]